MSDKVKGKIDKFILVMNPGRPHELRLEFDRASEFSTKLYAIDHQDKLNSLSSVRYTERTVLTRYRLDDTNEIEEEVGVDYRDEVGDPKEKAACETKNCKELVWASPTPHPQRLNICGNCLNRIESTR